MVGIECGIATRYIVPACLTYITYVPWKAPRAIIENTAPISQSSGLDSQLELGGWRSGAWYHSKLDAAGPGRSIPDRETLWIIQSLCARADSDMMRGIMHT